MSMLFSAHNVLATETLPEFETEVEEVAAEQFLGGETTSIIEENGKFVCYTNGVRDTAINGYITYEGTKFRVVGGELATDVNGLAQDLQNPSDWYYCANGVVQKYTGLAMYDGAWFYVVNGMLQ